MTLREVLEHTERYVVEIIGGRRQTLYDRCFCGVLFLASRLYRNLVQLRLTLYRERVIRQRMLGCFVISVGNLTCGGTGKTPVVEVFARTLAARGRRVAILSRGYRSKGRPLTIFAEIATDQPHPYLPGLAAFREQYAIGLDAGEKRKRERERRKAEKAKRADPAQKFSLDELQTMPTQQRPASFN